MEYLDKLFKIQLLEQEPLLKDKWFKWEDSRTDPVGSCSGIYTYWQFRKFEYKEKGSGDGLYAQFMIMDLLRGVEERIPFVLSVNDFGSLRRAEQAEIDESMAFVARKLLDSAVK